MIRSYLTAAFRNILKNKVFSLINVLGLAIGMAGCMLITQYVLHELSYDQVHTQKAQIFRMQLDRYNKGVVTTRWAAGAVGIGPNLKRSFPEVKTFVRMHTESGTVANGDRVFTEEHLYYASEDFFKMFSFPLISGIDSLVLKEPFTVALSATLAKKYFDDEDPIGKTLKVGRDDYEVTGVFEDVPENSHMRFDALLSFGIFQKRVREAAELDRWDWDGFMTYILLDDKTDKATFESKLPAFVEKWAGETMKGSNEGMVFHLEPLTDIHLYSNNLMMEFGPNGNARAVYFLAIIAGFILVIAWINYINLATARSMERAREVGVRKVMGSLRSQLIRQFLLESFVVMLAAFGIALLVVWLAMPYFSELTGRKLEITFLAEISFWMWAAAIFAAGILLAGLYPALVMSGFKPILVLKGRLHATTRGGYLRKGLVVFQFIASITLIVGTFTIYRQLHLMRNSDLGVDIEQTLVLRGPDLNDSTYDSRFQAFQNDILTYPGISNLSASTAIPGRQPGWNAGGIRRVSESDDQANQYRIVGIDYDFVETFRLKLVAGRNFSKDFSTDRSGVIFNESAVKLMGFKSVDEAVGEKIFFWGETYDIIGVLKDYRQESLKKNFEPLIFRCIPDATSFYSIRLKTSTVSEAISLAEEKYKKHFPGNPFQYFFLDDYYNQQYQADQQFGKVFGLFASLAIFIACLGLFGLSSYTVVQRTKEIGVRKVLGATVPQVIALLFRDFVILVVVAIVLAIPASWWLMDNWLNEFATRIALSWWIFAVPSLLVIAIAWLTIGMHTYKAAAANPVDSLRYE